MRNIFALFLITILFLACSSTTKTAEESSQLKSVTFLSFNKRVDSTVVSRTSFAINDKAVDYSDYIIPVGIDSLRVYRHYMPFLYAEENKSISVLSGFENNKQVIIVDSDLDLNFENNSKRYFSLDFGKQIDANFKLAETASMDSVKLDSNVTFFKVYPHYGYSQPIRDVVEENYYPIIKYYENYTVDLNHNKEMYNMYINHKGFSGPTVSVYKNELNLSPLPYNIKDTVLVKDMNIVLDSINLNSKKLFISHVDALKERPQNGGRVGGFLKEKFDIIDGKQNQSLANLIGDADYIMIDFWGTWCVPCIELLPDIKRISENNPNLKVLSVACEESVGPVKRHIDEKSMTWLNAFIETKPKSRPTNNVLKNLKITMYPTFILVDKQGKIIYRGVGKDGLEDISKLVSKS